MNEYNWIVNEARINAEEREVETNAKLYRCYLLVKKGIVKLRAVKLEKGHAKRKLKERVDMHSIEAWNFSSLVKLQ